MRNLKGHESLGIWTSEFKQFFGRLENVDEKLTKMITYNKMMSIVLSTPRKPNFS